jgi:hypothetical protein
MTEQEIIECLEKNYKPRRRRLCDALRDEAQRTDQPLNSNKGRCAICTLKEHGGGLVPYRLRDGQELLLGHRCAQYLEYLIAHPEYARHYC